MTEKRRVGRPPTGETPRRTVRIDEDTWEASTALARAEDTTVSAVIVDLLRERLAHRSEPLDPGAYLTVPVAVLDAELGPENVVTQALSALCRRLTGWLPPDDWTADDIAGHLDQAIAGRIPPGHFFGLAEEPSPAGTQAYGVWPG